MILFHGSNMEIGQIDLNLCRPYKDFGRGFYTDVLTKRLEYKELTSQISFHTNDAVNLLKKTGAYNL